MFSPFQELLNKAIRAHGMEHMVEGSVICAKFAEVKPGIFPEDTESRVTAKHFKSNILTIEVPDSVWANEVINRKDAIIAEVNAKYGQAVIQRIKTELAEMKKDEML